MSHQPEWIAKGRPALVLAPMEGVVDPPMRTLLSEVGGFSYCVSEFLRISQEVPPVRTYSDHMPELRSQCRTPAGLPVQLQLLGGDPEKLAMSALRACQIGATAIDLNFGCPAPTVNRHDGGATLLKFPDRIRTIVGEVRTAVPANIPVSAKLRLGFDDMNAIHLNARMAEEGGASWITIHGRTKVQGYIPPAYWGPIGEVRKALSIPVVANGEIWSMEDLKRCREETGCEHFMLGRGALTNPLLALEASRELGIHRDQEIPGELNWYPLIERFAGLCAEYTDRPTYPIARIKQWLRMPHSKGLFPEYDELKKLQTVPEVLEFLLARTAPVL